MAICMAGGSDYTIVGANGGRNVHLNDRGLKGVDPFDPNLDREMKMRIYKECYNNPSYFLNVIVRGVK